MAGKAYFVCRDKENHILLYAIPDGMTVERFAEKTVCRECGERIDFSQEFNG